MAQSRSMTMTYGRTTAERGKKAKTDENFNAVSGYSEQDADENLTDPVEKEAKKENNLSSKSTGTVYTRCITASFRTQQMVVNPNADGREIFSYQSKEQEFQIYIRNDGTEKKYTIAGTDESGEPFEKEFDPYTTDLTDADYTEFSALCMYIRQTDDTADLIANEYFSGDDIFEKKDFLQLMNHADTDSPFSHMQKMMDSLNNLMKSLDDFMTRQMSWAQAPSEDTMNALFVDKAVWAGPVRSEEETVVSRIEETKVVRNTSSLDPDTGEKIEGKKMSITMYGQDGIRCKHYEEVDGKWVEQGGWTVMLPKPGDYETIQDFLAMFDKDADLTFAAQEDFWHDFLDGRIDAEDFREYYDTTNNGYLDFQGTIERGESLRALVSHPYAQYFNNADFIRNVYTEEELRAMLIGGDTEKLEKAERISAESTEDIHGNDYESAIGLYREGNQIYPVVYAADSTEEDPIIRIGKTEYHVNDIDPRRATKAELCALESYMNNKGMIPNTGRMRSYSRMLAYAGSSSDYRNQSADEDLNTRYDWISILNQARMDFLGNPQLRFQANDCGILMGYLNTWLTRNIA